VNPSSPVKLAHLGDLHFGFSQLSKRTPDGSQNQREADVERAALLVADYLVEEEKPDLVVVAGDMLDATRISTPGLMGARQFVRRIAEGGIPLIVVGGNHDHVESPILPMLEILREDGALIYLRQDTLELAGLRLHLVPFRALARSVRAGGFMEEFDFSPDLPNVLVAHASVEGKAFQSEDVEVPLYWVEDKRFDLVMLGHIHDRGLEVGERAFYSGALEVLNFGERDKIPGFYLHELDGRKLTSREVTVQELADARGVALVPRPVRQYQIEAEGKTIEDVDTAARKILSDPAKVEGAMVKLIVHNVSSAFSREPLRKVWQQLFADAGGFDLEVVAQTRRVGELLDVEFAAPPVDLGQAFAEFLTEQDFKDAKERQELIELGRDVLTSARAKLIEQES
jgi:DNA repair exonuclease SbcCD nuclease subunit